MENHYKKQHLNLTIPRELHNSWSSLWGEWSTVLSGFQTFISLSETMFFSHDYG